MVCVSTVLINVYIVQYTSFWFRIIPSLRRSIWWVRSRRFFWSRGEGKSGGGPRGRVSSCRLRSRWQRRRSISLWGFDKTQRHGPAHRISVPWVGGKGGDASVKEGIWGDFLEEIYSWESGLLRPQKTEHDFKIVKRLFNKALKANDASLCWWNDCIMTSLHDIVHQLSFDLLKTVNFLWYSRNRDRHRLIDRPTDQ